MICLKSPFSVMTSLLRGSPRAPATTTVAAKLSRPEGAPPFAFRAFGWGRTDEGAAMTVATKTFPPRGGGPQPCSARAGARTVPLQYGKQVDAIEPAEEAKSHGEGEAGGKACEGG